MAKYLSGNYMPVPFIFTDKVDKYGKIVGTRPGRLLSPKAKVVYLALKDHEHHFTGNNNAESRYAYYYMDVDDDKRWFYMTDELLAHQANISLSSVTRAKEELRKAGFILTCKMFLRDKATGILSERWITGYLLLADLPFI